MEQNTDQRCQERRVQNQTIDVIIVDNIPAKAANPASSGRLNGKGRSLVPMIEDLPQLIGAELVGGVAEVAFDFDVFLVGDQ